MFVLVACEESQTVTKAFREKGCEAFSCDILEPSGGHPEWHILGDAIPLINGHCSFYTMDNVKHTIPGKSMPTWYSNVPKNERSKIRSKTFPGIAEAMAQQWT